MAARNLIIDNVDIRTDFGVSVEQAGYRQLVQEPKRREVPANDWHEEHGSEYDLTDPARLEPRSIELPFVSADFDRYLNFVNLLASVPPVKQFNFIELGTINRLRLDSQKSLNAMSLTGRFALTLIEDTPRRYDAADYDYTQQLLPDQGYSIDGTDLGRMGIYVQESARTELLRLPTVKPNQSMQSSTQDGQTYDNSMMHFEPISIKLPYLIATDSVSDFWERHEMLFALLYRAGQRTLAFGQMSIPCYYTAHRVDLFRIYGRGSVWCQGSVELTLINYTPAFHGL